MRKLLILMLLAGCQTATTPEGCPIMISEIGRAHTAACQRAYYEERARQSGGTITRCFGGPGNMTCISE